MFVFTEALVQNHSLQTAQNLLQEEVAHAEEHSEVCCRNRVFCLCDFTGFGHVRSCHVTSEMFHLCVSK